ncbi:AMP-binding enzyme [Natronolimnohabitans innermongolicus]|uniref:Acid-CoA ligase n=1 Tax=Natronolimnohabitans innermongolicus JCM 12255 TaxID=1227499 RepID=L9WKX3_9EURY|nr:AMP-binding protein [Natronolimnohabitans innermongolicus]ELY50150.1 acid-CoA ligase [Natronolimnohabitans innermongolicus JCM 12255]
MWPEAIETALERYENRYGTLREAWKDAGYWPETTFPERAFETIAENPEKRVIGPRRTETFEDLGTGEIHVSGPNAMVGYLDGNHDDDAFDGTWFATGDIGRLDGDGYLTITGRKKDVIVRGGENIPVKEVEDVLYEHPSVDDIAIVAMPDEEMQEKGCAYVRVDNGRSFSFGEMINHLDEYEMAKQKYPERLEIVDEFPRTGSGKIQKAELRERIAETLGMKPVRR